MFFPNKMKRIMYQTYLERNERRSWPVLLPLIAKDSTHPWTSFVRKKVMYDTTSNNSSKTPAERSKVDHQSQSLAQTENMNYQSDTPNMANNEGHFNIKHHILNASKCKFHLVQIKRTVALGIVSMTSFNNNTIQEKEFHLLQCQFLHQKRKR